MSPTGPTILTVAQVDKLAAACDLPDRVLVLLLAYGGLRIGKPWRCVGAMSTFGRAG
ncbi:hypothetical protein O7607_09535 [Micromonospora sp. WMMA1949]|uniref:hypothetical protein n=1 Tax=unclassified Micromonospora TaxID=2617518 RepID=UPI0022B666A7|nr:hypothetical protein [Micromonospora sp. WMMA1949]MCZ7425973.1 hypothetical protein [Micromonospora sp. WMMA1949]